MDRRYGVAFLVLTILVCTLTFSVISYSSALSPFEAALTQITKSITEGQNSLDPKDAIYNSNTSQVLGVKNLSFSPYRTTDERYFEHGLLKTVGNVTNNQTFFNTYLSNGLIVGRGNGTFETADGQSITWISSDLGRRNDTQWVYYGIMLFNSTGSKSFSLLNNSIALSKSSFPLMEPEYIWLLK